MSLKKFKLRAKKHWSTRVASTSKGQQYIIQALGPHGEDIFQVIEDSMALHFGSEVANEFRTDLLKIALKTGILLDEDEISVEDAKQMDKPFRDLCFQLMKDLGDVEEDKRNEVDPNELLACFQAMRASTLPMYDGHIQQKNIDKISKLYDTIENPDYIKFVMNNSEMIDCREVLRVGLSPMMELLTQIESEQKPPELCRSWRCSNNEIKSHGLFRGVGLCYEHYRNRLGVVLQHPRIDEFLEFKFLTIHFLDFLQNRRFYVDDDGKVQEAGVEDEKWEVDDFGNSVAGAYSAKVMHYYYFCESVKQYEVIQAKALRRSRSKKIIDKYIDSENARRFVWLPSEIVSTVSEAYANDVCHKTTFSGASEFCTSILNQVFEEFVRTIYYERAAASVTLPEEE